MKKLLLSIAGAFLVPAFIYAQCTTSNATSCVCKDGSSNCDLLPDIIIGPPPFLARDNFGIVEKSDTLAVTVSTPNVGHGPLELRSSNVYICGTDTFIGSAPIICPDSITYPKNLINQRIYHKDGNIMSSYDVPAGSMTYHPAHGHMHVDDWGIYTLRTATSNPDPMTWPIIGTGAKLAFCVEDYGTCDDYPGHCIDATGNSLSNADFPNWGLGGGSYNCSPAVQGISSGFVDIYWTTLAGMYVAIPPCTPNGTYWLVCKVDPNNNFIEENENNNVYATQFTLTKQDPVAEVYFGGNPAFCQGNSIQLTATANGAAYLWSTGETTQTIQANAAGVYTVSFTSLCGNTTTTSITVNSVPVNTPVTTDDNIPAAGSGTLTATGSGTINWYDAPAAGNFIGTGSPFVTPVVSSTTTFYAEDDNTEPGPLSHIGPPTKGIGDGQYQNNNTRYLTFDAIKNFTLISITTFASLAGTATIELRDASNNVLQSAAVNVPAGQGTALLNFNITTGTNYRIGLSAASSINLYRNSTGVTFPYTLPGVSSITGSSAAGYYYFFYDWVVQEPVTCAGARAPATVHVGPTGINNLDFSNTVNVYPNPSPAIFNISFVSVKASAVQLNITDAAGREVYNTSAQNVKGLFNKAVDMTANAKGVYVLKITCNDKVHYQKLTLK